MQYNLVYKKSDKWVGGLYCIYEDFSLSVDDVIAISKFNGVEYDKIDIGDPFVIVGNEPIYNFKYGSIIFQSDHKYTPLDKDIFKNKKYTIMAVTDISKCDNPNKNCVYMELLTPIKNGLCDAFIPLKDGSFYKVSLNTYTGELTEKNSI